MVPAEINPNPSVANGLSEADWEAPSVVEDGGGPASLPAVASPLPGPDAESAATRVISEVDIIMFLQAAKGAPLSVLFALGWSGRYMSHQELQQWTRCGHRQVTMALQSLGQMGWVSAKTDRGPWRITRGRRLPVEFALQEGSAPSAFSNDDSLNRVKEESIQTSALRGQLLEVLREYKIMEPTASRIAALPHVTEDYIRRHAEAVKREGHRVGLAITRMLMAAPAPPTQEEIYAEERAKQPETDFQRRLRVWPHRERAEREAKASPQDAEAQKRAELSSDELDAYLKSEAGRAWLAADPAAHSGVATADASTPTTGGAEPGALQ